MPSTFVESLESRTLFAFGVTATPTTYVVDTGADVTFTILRGGTTTSTIHLGDMTSVTYKGREMLASYAQTSRYSHYEQGLGSTTNVSYAIGGNGSWILVTCDNSDAASGGVIQYYAVRKGDNNIYMASLPTDVHNGPGEGRFIAYLSKSVFTHIEQPSNIAGNTGAIEGSDVFGFADGTTASKFYNSGRQMIDNVYHGVTGSAGDGDPVGAWMFMGDREHSAGGPFFKDIDFQTTGGATEIYNCLFTGHTQTEPFRQGLQGPYALQFNDGTTPAEPDYSWMEALNLQGWIPASQRGTLSGNAGGVPAGHPVTVGLSNAAAQYWGRPDAGGSYAIAGIQPGTYTETLYDNELEVGTRTVMIAAGATTRADITDTYYTPTPASTIFRIGTWDGTPAGFLNADRIETMHPSDVRMTPWASSDFVVGTNTDADWPMAQFMGVNNGQRITFTLTPAQAATAMTLRIGITLGFEGGRNRVTVNAGQSYAWTSSIPAASRDLNSRGVTRGTWRGDNQHYTYNIPASVLRAGVNTIDLPVVSGSYQSGQTWLSPNVVYDAIDLVTTSSLTNAPRVTTITLSPTNSTVAPNDQKLFTATARDQFGNTIPANFTWTTTAGTIDDTGLFTAPASGAATITATSGAVNGSITVSVTVTLGAFTDSGDIGSPSTPGSLSYAPATGTYTIKGGGADIWGTSDQFRYTYVPFGGAGTITARVVSVTNTNSNAKAGVMVRDSAAADAAYAFVWLSPGNLVKFETRSANGVASAYSASASAGTAPVWVKLVRSGTALDQFAAYYSLDDSTWTQIGLTQTVHLATAALAGLAVTSHNNTPGSLNTATFDNLSIAATVTGDQSAAGQSDAIRLVRNGTSLDVYLNNTTGTPTYQYDYASLGSFTVNGTSGDDVLTLDYAAGSPVPNGGVTFDGGTGANRLVVSGNSTTGDRVTVSSGNVSLSGGTAFGGIALPLAPGATVSLETATRLQSLTLAGGRFDLNAHDLLIDYTGPSPLATLRPSLRSADLFSSTNLPSRAVGYAEATSLGLHTFLDQPVDTTALLFKPTLVGDANLDGRITPDDYALTDRGRAKGLGTWIFGDFDYDGQVTPSDYALLNQSAAADSPAAPTPPAPAATPDDTHLTEYATPSGITTDPPSPPTPTHSTPRHRKHHKPTKPAKRTKTHRPPQTSHAAARRFNLLFSSIPIHTPPRA